MFYIPIALYLLRDLLHFELLITGTCIRWNLSYTKSKTKTHWLYKLNLVYLTSLEVYRRPDNQEELLTLMQSHWLLQAFYFALQKKYHTVQITHSIFCTCSCSLLGVHCKCLLISNEFWYISAMWYYYYYYYSCIQLFTLICCLLFQRTASPMIFRDKCFYNG